MILPRMIDRVFRQFNRERRCGDFKLARQARNRREAPRTIEQIFFIFAHFAKRIEAVAHDDVACGASERLIASVLNFNIVIKQRRADGYAGRSVKLRAVGAEFGVREDFDNGHWFRSNNLGDVASGKRFAHRAIHAAACEICAGLIERFGRAHDGAMIAAFDECFEMRDL